MPDIDSNIISYAVRKPMAFNQLRRAGITEDHFDDDFAKVWRWLVRSKKDHGEIPSRKIVETRFPNIHIHQVKEADLPILVAELKQRKKYTDLCEAIEEASRIVDRDNTDEVMSALQGKMNALSVNGSSSVIDLFSKEAQRRILLDQAKRRRGNLMGLSTGLKTFDRITGGLQGGRMSVIIGRTGLGKSWLDLLFVASAVCKGGKVGLYPLEMTLEETALRLYTIFSCKMMGPTKALKNLDLANGRVSKAKIVKLLNLLEDKYSGQLYVADIGSMSNPYTVERIEAEQEIYRFDMFWIDYLTLMKAPGIGRDGQEDYLTVKALSNGIKQVAVRQNTHGGVSAQVSREAMKVRSFLPRLEHISFGDSIGQDADHVIAINRKGEDLYYGMIKNRHGPEIGKTRVRFAVDSGVIDEYENQEDDDEED